MELPEGNYFWWDFDENFHKARWLLLCGKELRWKTVLPTHLSNVDCYILLIFCWITVNWKYSLARVGIFMKLRTLFKEEGPTCGKPTCKNLFTLKCFASIFQNIIHYDPKLTQNVEYFTKIFTLKLWAQSTNVAILRFISISTEKLMQWLLLMIKWFNNRFFLIMVAWIAIRSFTCFFE